MTASTGPRLTIDGKPHRVRQLSIRWTVHRPWCKRMGGAASKSAGSISRSHVLRGRTIAAIETLLPVLQPPATAGIEALIGRGLLSILPTLASTIPQVGKVGAMIPPPHCLGVLGSPAQVRRIHGDAAIENACNWGPSERLRRPNGYDRCDPEPIPNTNVNPAFGIDRIPKQGRRRGLVSNEAGRSPEAVEKLRSFEGEFVRHSTVYCAASRLGILPAVDPGR